MAADPRLAACAAPRLPSASWGQLPGLGFGHALPLQVGSYVSLGEGAHHHGLHPADDGGQQLPGRVTHQQEDGSRRRLFQQLEHGVGGGRVHQLGQPDDDHFEPGLEGLQAHQLQQLQAFFLGDAALLVFGPDVLHPVVEALVGVFRHEGAPVGHELAAHRVLGHGLGGSGGQHEVQVGMNQLVGFLTARALPAGVGGVGSPGFTVQKGGVGQGQGQRRRALGPAKQLGVGHVLLPHRLPQQSLHTFLTRYFGETHWQISLKNWRKSEAGGVISRRVRGKCPDLRNGEKAWRIVQ